MVAFTKAALLLAAAASAGLVAVQASPAAYTRVVYETVTSYIETTTVTPAAPAPTAVEKDASVVDSADTYAGEATYYNPSVGTGSCGWLNQDTELVAALNAPQFGNPANPNNSPFCGQQIVVKGPKGSVQATIVDKCPACKSGDIDLSPAAFNQIADEAQGRVGITWSFV